MTNIIIAKKYAKAVFELAKKLDLIDQFSSDLKIFSDNLSVSFIKELSNPAISRSDLSEITDELSERMNLCKEIVPFLETVVTSRRVAEFKEIKKQFLNLVKELRNILEAEVSSVCNLDKNSLGNIKEVLKNKYPNKEIKINQSIKKDILGGIVIKINSIVIDVSLKNQLLLLQKQLKV